MLTRRRAKAAFLIAAAASLAACSSEEPGPNIEPEDATTEDATTDDASSYAAPEDRDTALARLEAAACRELASASV